MSDRPQGVTDVGDSGAQRLAERPVGRDAAPGISVIVPAHDAAASLALCLKALRESEYPNLELIVVDDASVDATASVAAELADVAIRLEQQSGAAACRNRGAQAARHPYLLFIDADVCVLADTLRRIARKLASDPTIDGLFGSYDRQPGAGNLLSQYRNLLHHYVHQQGEEESQSFWSGCGAVKRSVFLDVGGFDTDYKGASIEDIELGARLRRAGYRVVLAKDVQVKHLKRWTLWQMVRCDVLHRALPWTLLLLREGSLPNDLNLRRSDRLAGVLSVGLLLTLLLGSVHLRTLLLLPVATIIALVLIDRWTQRRPIPWLLRILLGLASVASFGWLLAYELAGHRMVQLWALAALGFLLAIVALNVRFYLFIARVKGVHWVPLVIPLHVLYFLYSSLTFAAGLAWHLVARLRGAREPGPVPTDLA